MSQIWDRGFRVLAMAAACYLPAPASAQETSSADSAAVVMAADAWLALLDEGQYGGSFDSVAPLLQPMARSAEGWQEFLAMARTSPSSASE